MVTATVVIDLTGVGDTFDARYRLTGLSSIPDGARLVLKVPSAYVGWEAARLLAPHTARLQIDVQGEVQAVRQWLEVLRTHQLVGWSL